MLTEKTIAGFKPSSKRVHHYDEGKGSVRGFGVRVEPNGRKSYFWFAKVRGVPRFRALGEFPVTSLKVARDRGLDLASEARKWKESGYAGDDPFEKKQPTALLVTPTFRELVEAYVARHLREKANKPEKAEYDARWLVGKYFRDWLDRPVDEIRVEDMLTIKNRCGEKRYMANRSIEFVRAIFNWSARAEDGRINFWPVGNPAKGVSSYEERQRDRFLKPEELARFNDELKKERSRDLRDFLTLAITTGARKSDVLSMRFEDVGWETAVWKVPFPKNGESYNIQLLTAALGILKRRRREIPETEAHVFPGRSRSGHLENIKKPWTDFRKRAAIPDIRIHDIRRTHGSYLAIAGVSLPQIGAALGHRSLQSTAIYARLHDEAVRTAREAGEAKMIELMAKAKKRVKLAASRNEKLLGGAS